MEKFDKYRYITIVGLLLTILPIATNGIPPIVFCILFFSGLILLFYGSIAMIILQSGGRLKGVILTDERTKKIGYKVGAYTLFVTPLFILVVSSLAQLKIIDISLGQIF